MFLKCVVQRESILAASGFGETLSPLMVRKKAWICFRDFLEQDWG